MLTDFERAVWEGMLLRHLLTPDHWVSRVLIDLAREKLLSGGVVPPVIGGNYGAH